MKRSGSRRITAFLRRWATPLTVLGIALILVLNIGFAALSQNQTLYLDLTPEELYTLSDMMIEECAKVTQEITITFCDDPDRLLADYELRYIYTMALKLSQRFDNIKVETHNLTLNPTALDRFRPTSSSVIKSNYVIISCGERYRIYSDESFFISSSDEELGGYFSFDGEYVMATAFFSLAAIETPVVYFTVGHGESFYVHPEDTEHASLLPESDENASALYDLILKEGLKVDYLDLSTVSAVPDDCTLLIINNPTSDIPAGDGLTLSARSEIEVLDRYMSSKNSAIMLFKSPERSLHDLEHFAEKWGIGFRNDAIVKDDDRALSDGTGLFRDKLISQYTKDEGSFAWSIYRDISSIETAPPVIVEKGGSVYQTMRDVNDSVSGVTTSGMIYSDFLYSGDTASLYTLDGLVLEQNRRYALAAITVTNNFDSETSENYYSYFFCSASEEMATNKYLASETSYANYDVMFALVRYISGVNKYADYNLGSSSFNSENVGGKRFQHSAILSEPGTDYSVNVDYPGLEKETTVRLAFILVLAPLVLVPSVCAVVCIRRRYL